MRRQVLSANKLVFKESFLNTTPRAIVALAWELSLEILSKK
jgi:hypothetical protein